MINEKYIKVLYINLETEKIHIEHREDLMQYLGGVGIASKLFLENLKPDLPPMDAEQPIVFAIGAATYVFPVITKTVAMFISPLTGELGESYAGARLAMTLLMAGYDAVVITGKAKKQSYLSIATNNVSVKDARAIWVLSVTEVGQYIRDRERHKGQADGKRSILYIGPAGENGVSFACATVDTYRHFGRLGLGACMGAKNLKAISVYGNRSIPILNHKKYLKLYQQLYKKSTVTEYMAKYHDSGTPENIMPLNKGGGLPTRNMRTNSFEEAGRVCGESFALKNLVRKMSCTGCPVGCIHIGMYRREFDKGHEYEAISVSYDYELIFALGIFLGISNTDSIIALINEVEEYGLDAISTGVCLGWATDALEKGYITDEDTLVNLQFGKPEAYITAIGNLAKGVNAFYQALGKGSRHAASIYGGGEFAMQIAGNEMAGYHTGYGSLVGAAVGARHSHLDNGGYSLDQNNEAFDEDKYVDALFDEECERCMTNSLIMCLFARKIYDRQTIIDSLNALGWTLTDEDLTAIGRRIYKIKLEIKKALGFRQMGVKISKRFFETPSMNGILEEDVVKSMIRKYSEKTEEFLTSESD
ncbi:MAG: aldehyde:ferredoxin oxidoreductase [Oscillospiraceae bacterium]|jgi:aldehyde:ferredoxin oxidoreductase|nr:aldehyde:ferredoxin oxidoreductase [Oscillospiraceae bacterium]